MQYKTTIEVVTEAENKNEAADIAGEFLKGDVNAVADLKVNTISVARQRRLDVFLACCSVAAVLGSMLIGSGVYYRLASVEKKSVTSYAIQPPLNTDLSSQQGKEFKAAWDKENKNRVDSAAR